MYQEITVSHTEKGAAARHQLLSRCRTSLVQVVPQHVSSGLKATNANIPLGCDQATSFTHQSVRFPILPLSFFFAPLRLLVFVMAQHLTSSGCHT